MQSGTCLLVLLKILFEIIDAPHGTLAPGSLPRRIGMAIACRHPHTKYFLAGTGFMLGVALEDGIPTGERDELVCVGDSLAILADAGCQIDNLAELLEELCKQSPDAFCQDD